MLKAYLKRKIKAVFADEAERLSLLEVKCEEARGELEKRTLETEELRGLLYDSNKNLSDKLIETERILEENALCLKNTEERLSKTNVFLNNNDEINKDLSRRIFTVEENTRWLNKTIGDITAPQDNVYSKIDYFDFENRFRGSREQVMDIQKEYLKYFEGKSNVIDLGCGRGEFTELLQRQGISATGVDSYMPYIEYCRSKNLHVIYGDAVDFLREVKEPLGGIFAGQLIEHLNIDKIIGLCELAYEKLENGAYIVLETPNPTCLTIFSHAFYIDPSHQKPVHPLTIRYFLEKAGFSDIEVLYNDNTRLPYRIPRIESEAVDNLEEFNEAMKAFFELVINSQDYTIVGKKI